MLHCFYCEECGRKRNWPINSHLPRSRGPCMVCLKSANCFDVPMTDLPLPPLTPKSEATTCIPLSLNKPPIDEANYMEAAMNLLMKAGMMLAEEIGAEEYCWLVLKACDTPAHEIPNDPELLLQKMLEVANHTAENSISDERFYKMLTAMSEAGSPEVKQLIAAELMLLEHVKNKQIDQMVEEAARWQEENDDR